MSQNLGVVLVKIAPKPFKYTLKFLYLKEKDMKLKRNTKSIVKEFPTNFHLITPISVEIVKLETPKKKVKKTTSHKSCQ